MQRGVEWLDSLQSRGIKPGLDNIKRLLDGLGRPHDRYRTIHVAGSDGKGSVCCILESILRESGLKVGMFNSPHILKINECIRINGKDIDDNLLNNALEKVMGVSEEGDIPCTSFEALTACAFLAFSEAKVDIAVIETGMGGRLDSTNVIEPEVTVINNISLEHTAFLGDTIEKIATEKAGIMRPGVPCVTIENEGSKVIERYAEELGCPITVIRPEDIRIINSSPYGLEFSYKGEDYIVSMPGRYQGRNAAVAIEAIRKLKDADNVEAHIREGLRKARWPYRMEKLDGCPIVLDVTHTERGSECLKQDIQEIYGKVILVTAMLDDKDLEGVATNLSPIASKVYVSAPNSPRAASAERLAECYRRHHDDVTVCNTVGEAMKQALKNDGTILVTGSFRTAEDCLRWLGKMRWSRFSTYCPRTTTEGPTPEGIPKD